MAEDEILNRRYQISAYIGHAREALESSASSLANGYYATAINRAYYAIFYVASGLLASQEISRARHSGVLAAFREQYVKPGIIEPEYSEIYGDVMDARVDSDYDVTFEADAATAQKSLDSARRFVERVAAYLADTEGI